MGEKLQIMWKLLYKNMNELVIGIGREKDLIIGYRIG